MKIVAVCGMGIGTSVLLKMNIEKALRALDIDGTVEAADISSAKGVAQGADLVLTSEELAGELEGIPADVVVIRNFMSVPEITAAIEDHS